MTKPDLDAIAEQYRPAIEQIRKEREQLGLTTPENIEIKVMFSGMNTGAARDGVLYINPLHNIDAGANEQAELHNIGSYFDQLRTINRHASYIDDDDLILAMLYGEKDFSEFENRYPDEESFKAAKLEFEDERKKSFSYFMKHASKFACPPSQDTMHYIAHEVDHLDFEDSHESEATHIKSLEGQINPEDYNELSLLEESAKVKFEYRSGCEARGIFFHNLRREEYNPEKLDSVKENTIEALRKYVLTDFIIPVISYMMEKEGKNKGIGYKDLTQLNAFIHAIFSTNLISKGQRRFCLENFNKQDPELVGRIILGVTEKMKEYGKRCEKLVDDICEEYRQRMEM